MKRATVFRRVAGALALTWMVTTPAAGQQKPVPPKAGAQKPAPQKPAPPRPKQPRVFRGFVTGNLAIQTAASSLTDRFNYEVNAETATTNVAYASKTAPTFDVGVGWRFWKRSGVAVEFSRAWFAGPAQTESDIPHPFFDNQDRHVSGEAGNIDRTETAVHVQMFFLKEHRKWRTRILGGLTYFSVDQEAVTGINISESYPYDTAEFRSAATESSTGSGLGFNVGVDAARMFTPQFGLGGMLRFTRGSVDLNVAGGRSVSTHAGGVQAGAGIRIAF